MDPEPPPPPPPLPHPAESDELLSGLERLDGDALLQILCRLDGVSLARLAAASTTLRKAAIEEGLWAALVRRFFWVRL